MIESFDGLNLYDLKRSVTHPEYLYLNEWIGFISLTVLNANLSNKIKFYINENVSSLIHSSINSWLDDKRIIRSMPNFSRRW